VHPVRQFVAYVRSLFGIVSDVGIQPVLVVGAERVLLSFAFITKLEQPQRQLRPDRLRYLVSCPLTGADTLGLAFVVVVNVNPPQLFPFANFYCQSLPPDFRRISRFSCGLRVKIYSLEGGILPSACPVAVWFHHGGVLFFLVQDYYKLPER